MQSPPDPARPQSQLIKRLPILLFIALGIFLYKSNLFPQTRTLVWQTGASRVGIQQVDLQIWSKEGELLKRELRRFNAGAPVEVSQELTLEEGDYEARYVIERTGTEPEGGVRALRITGEETYYLSLGRE